MFRQVAITCLPRVADTCVIMTKPRRHIGTAGAIKSSSIVRDRDVYRRLLRNVAVDGQDVGEALIADGVAREYAGGRRPWCG